MRSIIVPTDADSIQVNTFGEALTKTADYLGQTVETIRGAIELFYRNLLAPKSGTAEVPMLTNVMDGSRFATRVDTWSTEPPKILQARIAFGHDGLTAPKGSVFLELSSCLQRKPGKERTEDVFKLKVWRLGVDKRLYVHTVVPPPLKRATV